MATKKIFLLGLVVFLFSFAQMKVVYAFITKEEAESLLKAQSIETSEQNINAYRQSINLGMTNKQALDNVNKASVLKNDNGLPTPASVSTNEGKWSYNGNTLVFTPNQSFIPAVKENKRNYNYTLRRASGIEEVIDESSGGSDYKNREIERYNDAFNDLKNDLRNNGLENTPLGKRILNTYRNEYPEDIANDKDGIYNYDNGIIGMTVERRGDNGLNRFAEIKRVAAEQGIDLNDVIGYEVGEDGVLRLQTTNGELYPPSNNGNGGGQQYYRDRNGHIVDTQGNVLNPQPIGMDANSLPLYTGVEGNQDDNNKDTGGLVPCGHGTNVDDRCTLCDLFVGIDRIIKWGRNILVAVALTALVAGGIMYIVSAGNQQMMENAKTLIQQALVGVLIVLGAWLIVNTVIWLLVVKSGMGVGAGNWWNFDCNAGGTSTSTSVNN